MDPKMEEALRYVLAYASDISEWMVLKKELLKYLPASARKVFSTRHPVTKEQSLNDFERKVIEYWKGLTGVELYLGKR
ncbi:MAG: hypothetical protein EBU33_02420 [Sphingobacteriia bacterium]|jgi:hypothetical protein|nr:hypothetical protein [Sphingobacteriia bacterium]